MIGTTKLWTITLRALVSTEGAMPTLVVGMPRSIRAQKHAHVNVGMAPDYPKSDATPTALSDISQV